jgi:hypothetical protein
MGVALPAAIARPQSTRPPEMGKLFGAVGQIVASDDGRPAGRRIEGSGIILTEDGVVVTSYHVVQGLVHGGRILFNPADPARVDFPLDPAKMLRLQFIRADLQGDLALFRIAGNTDGSALRPGVRFPWLSLGSFNEVKLLDSVYVIGFPEVGGETLTVVEGRVAGKDAVHEWIKVDASLSRGFSGGAVVNERGQLIGIATELHADVQEVEPGKEGTANMKVLYGIMNWIRPTQVLERLLKSASRSEMPPPKSTAMGLIEGRITSSQGMPVTGALVGLLKEGSQLATVENLISYARTDATGAFQLKTIPGKYTLRIVARGFEPQLEPMEVKRGSKKMLVVLRIKP